MEKASRNHTTTRIFTLNELSLRLSPALADEIGLNESIVLLQLEYWISISDHWIDGQRWTYQSVRQMQEKAFSFWSVATVARTVKSLLDKRMIIEGNYNKKSYDNTRWFSLNYKELSELRSIMIKGYDVEGSETPPFQIETPPLLQDETGLSQNETGVLQDETVLSQNETTIPQITPQITPETTPKNVIDVDDVRMPENDARQTEIFDPSEASGSSMKSHDVIGAKVIEFAEVNLKREFSEYEREILRDWCVKFRANPNCRDPESIVIAGLKSCVIRQDLSSPIAYLNTILESFELHNITSIDQIDILNQKRKTVQSLKDSRVPKGLAPTDKYASFYL